MPTASQFVEQRGCLRVQLLSNSRRTEFFLFLNMFIGVFCLCNVSTLDVSPLGVCVMETTRYWMLLVLKMSWQPHQNSCTLQCICRDDRGDRPKIKPPTTETFAPALACVKTTCYRYRGIYIVLGYLLCDELLRKDCCKLSYDRASGYFAGGGFGGDFKYV